MTIKFRGRVLESKALNLKSFHIPLLSKIEIKLRKEEDYSYSVIVPDNDVQKLYSSKREDVAREAYRRYLDVLENGKYAVKFTLREGLWIEINEDLRLGILNGLRELEIK